MLSLEHLDYVFPPVEGKFLNFILSLKKESILKQINMGIWRGSELNKFL